MYWAPSLLAPTNTSTDSTIDIPSLPTITDPQNNDLLLIYDISAGNNKKITKENLVGLSNLISSINNAGVDTGSILYGSNSTTFTVAPSRTYGRSLFNSANVNDAQSTLGLLIGTNIQAYSSGLTALSTSISSAINNDIFYYNSGSFSRVTLSNYVRDTLLTIPSAAALATGISAVRYTSSTAQVIPVWNDSTGTLINTGITIDGSDNITGVNSINGVTSTQFEQLSTNSSTISTAQWEYLGNMDQSVTTTDTVNFVTINASTVSITGSLNINSKKIINLAAPTAGGDAANKTYVDAVAASGLTPLDSAIVASISNVAYSYNNTGGSNNRGSLTAPSNGNVIIDGITLGSNERVLIKDQTTLLQNGIYIVDNTGSVSTPYVLERSIDFYPGVDPITQNSILFIENGSTNAGSQWILADTVTTVGTDPVNFTQFSSQFGAGNGLDVFGGNLNVVTVNSIGNIYINGSNEIDINGQLAINKGGTNSSSFTTNRLINFNGTSLTSSSLNPSDIVDLSSTQTLINKTLNSYTNDITSNALWNGTGTRASINTNPTAIGDVLKVSSLSPLQLEWLTESVNINGQTEITGLASADEFILYDASASANRKVTFEYLNANLTVPTPFGVIIVAKSNGNYITITDGLAAASSGDVVLVYPGTYAENITIPAGVRLVGYPASQQVIISGSDTTLPSVTMTNTSTLREVTVFGPTSGTGPAIDCRNLILNNLVVIFGVVVIGRGAGCGIQGAGLGVIAFLEFYQNGGILTGPLINLTSGNVLGIRIIGNAGSSSSLIYIAGNTELSLSDILSNNSIFYSSNNLIECSSSGACEIDSIITPDNSPYTNGIHITADGINLSLSSSHLHTTDGGFDILIDSGLTGTGTEILIQGEIIKEKISVPIGYSSGCLSYIIYGIDKGLNNDANVFFDNEVNIGSINNPSELAVGEGDSTTKNMVIFSYNGSTFTNNTTAAKSRINSSFNLFSSVTGGNIAYFGETTPRQFYNIKVNLITPITIGSGEIEWQYYSSSLGDWTGVNVMSSQSTFPYIQQATGVFMSTGTQIRFDYNSINSDWTTTTINSQLAYWIRCYIISTITTSPVIQRIKLGTNRTEINQDGFIECYGKAQTEITIPINEILQSLGNPSTASFNLSTNVSTLQLPFSQFAQNQNQGHAYKFILPYGVDTSRPLTILIQWAPNNNSNGTVVLFASLITNINQGSIVNGTLQEIQKSVSTALVSQDDILQLSTFIFDINTVEIDNIFILQISRNGGQGSDTYNNPIRILSTQVKAIIWT